MSEPNNERSRTTRTKSAAPEMGDVFTENALHNAPENEIREASRFEIENTMGRTSRWASELRRKKEAKPPEWWDVRSWSSTSQMFLAVCVGAGLGAIINATVEQRTNLAFWIGFPGRLFLRALKCLVIPLVFCSMVCGVVELSTLGQAGAVGKHQFIISSSSDSAFGACFHSFIIIIIIIIVCRLLHALIFVPLTGGTTFGLYMMTTVISVVTGLIYCSIFMGLYSSNSEDSDESDPLHIALVCNKGDDDDDDGDDDLGSSTITRVLTATVGGGLECRPFRREQDNGVMLPMTDDDPDELLDALPQNATFGLLDVNDLLMTGGAAGGGLTQRDIPETIAATLESIVTDNFTAATAQPDILAIICFAIFFGFALAKLDGALGSGETNVVLVFCTQLNAIVATMLEAVLAATPLAVASLIAGAIATVDDFGQVAGNIGVLVASVFVAMAWHLCVNLPAVMLVTTGGAVNPVLWYRQCTEAYVLAFSSASSAGTLPKTIQVVQGDGAPELQSGLRVPEPLAKFICSLGATINSKKERRSMCACMQHV